LNGFADPLKPMWRSGVNIDTIVLVVPAANFRVGCIAVFWFAFVSTHIERLCVPSRELIGLKSILQRFQYARRTCLPSTRPGISRGVAPEKFALPLGNLIRPHRILGHLVVTKFFCPHIVIANAQGTEQVGHSSDHSRRTRNIEDGPVESG
jgi:hypothetical protein